MPYKNNSDLPESIKNHLPDHGQSIFREAFNNAWKEYKDASSRKGNATQEETCFKVAWNAVKKVYKKDTSGKWVKKKNNR